MFPRLTTPTLLLIAAVCVSSLLVLVMLKTDFASTDKIANESSPQQETNIREIKEPLPQIDVLFFSDENLQKLITEINNSYPNETALCMHYVNNELRLREPLRITKRNTSVTFTCELQDSIGDLHIHPNGALNPSEQDANMAMDGDVHCIFNTSLSANCFIIKKVFAFVSRQTQ